MRMIQENRSHSPRFTTTALSTASLRIVLGLAMLGLAPLGVAQNAVATEEVIEEIISVGVRSKGRVATTSPVPVDAFNSDVLQATGQVEVGRMLQILAPSFNFSSSTISDGTDALRPATLRGLGPDQTLVLVNGKRRHNSALLHVNTSVGRGTAGTDLNAIPSIAIKRIEILRDGAAAQYGSDAIAGVINLVLKDGADGGESNFHIGEYSEGDGRTLVFNTNYGWDIGSGGSLNASIEGRKRDATNRAGLTAACQFTCTDAMLDGNEVQQTTDTREINFNRRSFRIGDADSEQLTAVMNLDVPLEVSYLQNFYLFTTYSERDNTSGGFYRRANQSDRNPSLRSDDATEVNDGEAFIEFGFLPLINTTIKDFSIDVGVNGERHGWQWDFSLGYGSNTFDFDITNSLNASLVSDTGSSPRSAFAGRLVSELVTTAFGAYRKTDWGSFAFGGGYKNDRYGIQQGEDLSWRDYDTTDAGVSGASNAVGGIQVFPGFRPENAVNEDRRAIFGYVDVEWDIADSVLVTGAGRLEDYSDFGSTFNLKGTIGWSLSEALLLRGAISTGFRAPSLHQRYFSSVSTQFNSAGVASQVGTFRNDSELAQSLGIPALKEETSLNLSLGAVWRPSEVLTITADFYNIEIDDRIVISGNIDGSGAPALRQRLDEAGAGRAQFFLNAADTETIGIDVVATFSPQLPTGLLSFSLGANFTETKITAVRPPAELSDVPGISEALFTSQDRSIITEWQPKSRISFVTDYSVRKWNFNAGLQHYGKYTVEDGDRQTFGAKTLVDASVSYDLGKGLSIRAGGNNIFDTRPDLNTVGQTRGGVIIDGDNNVIVDSPGVFQYSRRSAPFGFNGAYFYLSLGVSY